MSKGTYDIRGKILPNKLSTNDVLFAELGLKV